VQALETLVDVDSEWVPSGAGQALYLRPFAFATDVTLGAGKPSDSYLFVVLASPATGYFGSAVRPISVGLSEKYVRAAPGGTGFAKAGANYAGALLGSAEAAEHGCDQVIWLDAAERRCVEEVGAMNLCFVTVPGPKPG
jgi:branched-chain amino acid aminotransferase